MRRGASSSIPNELRHGRVGFVESLAHAIFADAAMGDGNEEEPFWRTIEQPEELS